MHLAIYRFFLLQIALFLMLSQSIISAQNALNERKTVSWQDAGLPFIQNFRPKETHSLPQNFAIIQDHRGVMYFGNSAGVLEYDGSSWRLIQLPGLSEAYSLTIDKQGLIFVGGNNELGYLKPDTNGQMRYISLLEYVPSSNREFGPVWKSQATSEGIFFGSLKCLIRLRKTANGPEDLASWSSKVWMPDESFYTLHSIQNQIFVSLPQKLFKLSGDSLHLIQEHKKVTNSTINLMLPYSEKTIIGKPKRPEMLVGTRYDGLFLFDGISLKPFKTEAETYLKKNALYHGAMLPDGRYALATLWGGVVIIDRKGRLLQIVDKKAGLHNETILFVFPDREGGLWLGTNNGIARIEASTPLTVFQESQGLTGGVSSVIRHKGRLYVGTSAGLGYLAEPASPGISSIIKFLPETQAQTRALLSLGSSLLVGSSKGIYLLDENDDKYTIARNNPSLFFRSQQDPRRIYISLMDGLAILPIIKGKPQSLLRLPEIKGDLRLIAEDTTGVIWAGAYPQGLWRVELPATEATQLNPADIKIERFGQESGLPNGWAMPYRIQDRIIFATAKGLRRFDAASRTFQIDSSLGLFFADTNHVFHSLVEDSNKRIWMAHSYNDQDEIGFTILAEDGTYNWNPEPFSRINDFGYLSIIYADPEQPGVIWFGCQEALVRYDSHSPGVPNVDFSTLLRRVKLNQDLVLYGGAGMPFEPSIAYENNALLFEYAAPVFDNPAATRYQFYLEGLEKEWSDWVADTKKEYNNLPVGEYHFHVRAKNVYKQIGHEACFAFTILPPWYRTWWAYLIYLIFAAVSIFYFVHWRVHILQQKAQQLESIVAERTAQVEAQKSRLEEQSQQLKEMDQVKSRFFANISHEFRTPLTLIIGPLNKVLDGLAGHNTLEEIKMMHRSAKNLLRLVNQLLALSSLESGKMQLHTSEGDLITCIKDVIVSFDSMFKSHNIRLRFHTSVDSLNVWFNRGHLETVIYNLLGNAFKFTADGGEIDVIVDCDCNTEPLNGTENNSATFVKISVKDNGIGIPADKLPYVFDRFYQVNNGHSEFAGTGIGLALVKELVELHHGLVEINSKQDQGTEVLIRLPLGKSHLKPEEMQQTTTTDQLLVDREPISIIRESADKQPAAGNGIKILVIEDNADMRAFIRDELQSAYQVVEAKNGATGIDNAFNKIPDLIVSDVMMPKMDGYQVCKKLKNDERTSHIPIILLTAKAGRDDKLDGLETGADDYLTKPFDVRELQIKIKNLIALRRNMQKKFQKQMSLQSDEMQGTSKNEIFLKKAIAIVEKRLEDESFSPTDLAGALKMSRAQFYRKIRALTNQSAGLFIRSVRLQRASKLLQHGDDSITEIAFKVGFSSHAYFTKCFSEYFGLSPKKFKQKHLLKDFN